MTAESPHGNEPPHADVGPGVGRRPWLNRLPLACALALLAAVLVIAAVTERAEPVEPSERIGRRIELTELITQERERAEQLQQQVEELSERVAEYESMAVAGSDEVADLQDQVEEVGMPAGLQAIEGPGLQVTLEDSSRTYDGTQDPNDFVIHEQDLRAVVNALWAGGAEAISINDSRVMSTSGIRCVGNTLYLNGRHYAPPFVIKAIGEPGDLEAGLAGDPSVQRFAASAEEHDLGFDVGGADEFHVPAHTGLSGLDIAVPGSRES